MENYLKRKLVGGRLSLKKGVLSHKLSCQGPSYMKNENTMVHGKDNNWVDRIKTDQATNMQLKKGVRKKKPTTVDKKLKSKKLQQKYTKNNKENQASNMPSEAKETIDDMDENMLNYSSVSGNISEHDNEEFLCNVCDMNIVGFRYTCVQCAEFDICSACEALQAHAAHYVLRVPAHRPLWEVSEMLERVRAQVAEIQPKGFQEPEINKPESKMKSEPDPLKEEPCSRPHSSNMLEQSLVALELFEVKEEPLCAESERADDAPTTADLEAAPAGQPPPAPAPRVAKRKLPPAASQKQQGQTKKIAKETKQRNDSGSEEEAEEEEEGNFQLLRYFRELERERQLDVENAELDKEMASSADVQGSEPDSLDANDAMPEDIVVSGTFEWTENYDTFTGVQETYSRVPGPTTSSVCPYDLFTLVWDDTIMESIALETNKYMWGTVGSLFELEEYSVPPRSRLRDWRDTTPNELRTFFAVLIYMSLDYKSRLDEYWSTGVLGIPEFRAVMGRDRFLMLLRFIHFVDNSTIDESMSACEKQVAKVIPVVEHCNAKFQELYIPQQQLSLDEAILFWQGRLSWQCTRPNANRSVIKSFDLCDADSGYLLKTLVCTSRGSSTECGDERSQNPTANIVLKLMDGYLDVGHSLYMGHWYNQMPLTRFLKSRRTDVVGTQNRRRSHVPHAIKRLRERSMEHGQMVWRHCGDINLVAWKDERLVAFVSTYHHVGTIPGQTAGQAVSKPSMVSDYNRYMGGVDLKDQMLSKYLMERKRVTKWYLKLFMRLINTSLLNAYIIHKSNSSRAGQPSLSHRKFRFAVAESLVRRNRAPDVLRQVNQTAAAGAARVLGGVCHEPDHTEVVHGKRQRRRCVRCTALGLRRTVSFRCVNCNVGLCLGRCFREYHTPKD